MQVIRSRLRKRILICRYLFSSILFTIDVVSIRRKTEKHTMPFLNIIILTALLVMSASASLENTPKFQFDPLPSLVDRVHNDHNIILMSALSNDAEKQDVSSKKTLSINGTVFGDLDNNAIKDKDEPGLPGWTITLRLNGENVSQNTTDDSGRYSFINLSIGKYTVTENAVTGWNQTSPGERNVYNQPG